MATTTITYRTSTAPTVTALNGGISSSATWVAGWTSGTIDNTTNKDVDILISGSLVAESSGLSAGEIRVYSYAMLDDSTWPDVFSAGTEGTEGTATIHDTNILASNFRLLWATATDTTASQVYPFPKTSLAALYGGVCPAKSAIFVTQSTGTTLETSGNAIYLQGVYYTTA